MSIETLQFLDKQSVEVLALELLNRSKTRINERIVNEVNENSSDKQALSAKALYELLTGINTNADGASERADEHDTQLANNTTSINNLNTSQGTQDGKLTNIETNLDDLNALVEALTHITNEVVVGPIESVTDPRPDVMYYQKDNDADTMWMLYLYRDGKWVGVGDTAVDLTVIWNKDETQQLREALGIHDVEAITDTRIEELVDIAFSEEG